MGSSLYPEDAFLIVGEESILSIDIEETEMHLEVFQTLKESFLKAYKGKNLVIGNIGDSRAVLAMRGEDDSLTVVQLTVDLKPDLPESDIDQFDAYYQAARGEKKRRVFGLGSEAKRYYGQTLCVSCGKTSSSASHEFCLAFVIFGIVDDVGFFKDSWLMFGAMEVLDIIMCLDVAMFGIVDV
ncbi:putative DNA repair protein recA -like protein 3, mitochondrial-like [Capsicum annuum]|nr:putative DNA repair protein recA -like protein 3, mitochondrial-like [Capsicum annuum]KAF3658537.1 putative DNA repair protein recA -like protein 3, mitochondrial-like [Capsicum annuum]